MGHFSSVTEINKVRPFKFHPGNRAEVLTRGGEGGYPLLIWPIRGRAAGQGMVFRPLCPEQGIQFYVNLS